MNQDGTDVKYHAVVSFFTQQWGTVLCLLVLSVCMVVPSVGYWTEWNLDVLPRPWLKLGVLLAGCIVSLFCCVLFKQPCLVKSSSLLAILGVSLMLNLLINRNIQYHIPQLPHAVLLTAACIMGSYAVLRRFACILWTVLLAVTFIQSVTFPLMGVVLDSTVIVQIIDATSEEIKAYATFRNISLIALVVVVCAFVSNVPYLILRKEKTITACSASVFLLCLFFLSRNFFVARDCNHPDGLWPVSSLRDLSRNVEKGTAENEHLLSIIRSLPSCASKKSAAPYIQSKDGVICILHIGESTRADHFSINGYKRNTTPRLEKREGLINFKDCVSSAPITTHAFITILTDGRRGLVYNPDSDMYPKTGCVIDLFHKHGFDCYGLWGPDAYKQTGLGGQTFASILFKFMSQAKQNICHSTEILDQAYAIKKMLSDNVDDSNRFFIINNQGSHVPFNKYDDSDVPFQPSSRTAYADSPMHDPDAARMVVNAYDNTIYTLDRSIETILQGAQGKPYIYMYVGDHGEYIGDEGLWNRSQAMDENVFYSNGGCKVPFFIIYSPEFVALNPHFAKAVENLKKNAGVLTAHEHVFHTLLGIFGINSPYYNAELDLSSPSVKSYSGLHPGSFSEEKQEISQ